MGQDGTANWEPNSFIRIHQSALYTKLMPLHGSYWYQSFLYLAVVHRHQQDELIHSACKFNRSTYRVRRLGSIPSPSSCVVTATLQTPKRPQVVGSKGTVCWSWYRREPWKTRAIISEKETRESLGRRSDDWQHRPNIKLHTVSCHCTASTSTTHRCII